MRSSFSNSGKLSIGWMIAIGVVALSFITVGILGLWALGTYNTQVGYANLIEAKTEANKTDLSNLKSKFSEVAQVTDAQMAQLSDLFTRYAEARTSENAGAVMNWVQETVPNVDQSTYRNLQNIIVATRDSWTERQKELVDLVRVYNTALDRMPGGALLKLFGFERKKAIIVITTDTKRAFETGTDEPAQLFPNRSQPEKK